LGIEIEKLILQILKQLIVCSTTEPQIKRSKLPEISVNLDLLKVLIRLCYDTKSIDLKAYIKLQEKLQKIGRMLGDWIRSLK